MSRTRPDRPDSLAADPSWATDILVREETDDEEEDDEDKDEDEDDEDEDEDEDGNDGYSE
jgi:hypothetical protein